MNKNRIAEPNYTQSPNVFYDELLREIDTLAELKVTDVIIRHTFGYHKDAAKLSYAKLQGLTGMGRDSVAAGLRAALERGTIGRDPSGNSFEYYLVVGQSNQTDEPEQLEVPTEIVGKSNQQIVGSTHPSYSIKESSKENSKERAMAKAEKPKAERPRNLVYEAIADVFFGIKDISKINGDGSRIGKLWGWLKKAEPGITPERIQAFGAWYDRQTADSRTGNSISRPKDLAKVQEWWARFKETADKPVIDDPYLRKTRV